MLIGEIAGAAAALAVAGAVEVREVTPRDIRAAVGWQL